MTQGRESAAEASGQSSYRNWKRSLDVEKRHFQKCFVEICEIMLQKFGALPQTPALEKSRKQNRFSAFLFPHSLYFYVHGMLASQLVHPLALARRAERMTYSCFQRNRGRRLGAPVVRAANINSGAESRRCEEHAQPATCRLSRRRRQQLLRQNQKAPPRKGGIWVGRHD